MYAGGRGVTKDESKARGLYAAAAAQGNAHALHNLGTPRLVERCTKVCVTDCRCFPDVFVGKMYADGQAVVKDESKAVQLWMVAASQGSAEAQYALGTWLSNRSLCSLAVAKPACCLSLRQHVRQRPKCSSRCCEGRETLGGCCSAGTWRRAVQPRYVVSINLIS